MSSRDCPGVYSTDPFFLDLQTRPATVTYCMDESCILRLLFKVENRRVTLTFINWKHRVHDLEIFYNKSYHKNLNNDIREMFLTVSLRRRHKYCLNFD